MSDHVPNVHVLNVLTPISHSQRHRTDYLVVHCADTPAKLDVGAVDIRKWHVKERGWKDIGYHYVIRRNGTIERGRQIMDVGAHVEGKNSCSLGICLVGKQTNYENVQWESLRALLTVLQRRFPNAEILGHCNLDSHKKKFCPGFDVNQWWTNNQIIQTK